MEKAALADGLAKDWRDNYCPRPMSTLIQWLLIVAVIAALVPVIGLIGAAVVGLLLIGLAGGWLYRRRLR